MSNKPKVLILPSWYPRVGNLNSGSYFREQANLMTDDFDVKVLTLEKEWISNRRYYLNKIKKVKQLNFQKIEVFPPDGWLLKYRFVKAFSQEKNLEIVVEDILYFLKHLASAQNWQPDLIHAHCSKMGGVIAFKINQATKIPYLITEHFNPFLLDRFNAFEQKMIRKALENANEVLAVSNHQAQNILMQEIDCHPIAVGNFVDDKKFTLKESKPASKTIEILFITLYPNFIKDVETFFESLAILKNSNFDFHATIIGGMISGEFTADYYENYLDNLGLKGRYTRLKSVDREEMASYFQAADVLVSSSIAESFGVAICESLLCGTPVISTINGGVSDYFTQNSGVLVPLKNPEAIAQEILKLDRDKYDAKVMRDEIVSNYGAQAFTKRIKDIYINNIK